MIKCLLSWFFFLKKGFFINKRNKNRIIKAWLIFLACRNPSVLGRLGWRVLNQKPVGGGQMREACSDDVCFQGRVTCVSFPKVSFFFFFFPLGGWCNKRSLVHVEQTWEHTLKLEVCIKQRWGRWCRRLHPDQTGKCALQKSKWFLNNQHKCKLNSWMHF